MSVKLTDFGFAQLRQLEHKRETQPRGSVFWMVCVTIIDMC